MSYTSIFDELFPKMGNIMKDEALGFKEAFPPNNLYTTEKGERVIELALAGYRKEDLQVSVEEGTYIVVSANPPKVEDTNKYYTHRVKTEEFKRYYTLTDNFEGLEHLTVTYVDGILKIVIPPVEPKQEARRVVAIN